MLNPWAKVRAIQAAQSSCCSIACLISSPVLPVDFMTSQMTEMQREVDDKLKIEAALKAAEQARKEVRWDDP